ncbi:hypothetical protein [Hymenobacter koreensis]|uniref:Uncharacterized protein n=1 Tax=Hymenobacter koreensis TaxID=1084523 RepID=A0ABP8J1K6_9BACT
MLTPLHTLWIWLVELSAQPLPHGYFDSLLQAVESFISAMLAGMFA